MKQYAPFKFSRTRKTQPFNIFTIIVSGLASLDRKNHIVLDRLPRKSEKPHFVITFEIRGIDESLYATNNYSIYTDLKKWYPINIVQYQRISPDGAMLVKKGALARYLLDLDDRHWLRFLNLDSVQHIYKAINQFVETGEHVYYT
jgi:hypothetical protein